MSEKFDINNYNSVKVEKLGGNNPSSQQENHNNSTTTTEENVKNVNFTPIPVQEVSGGSSESDFDRDDFSSDDELTDDDSDTYSDDDNSSASSASAATDLSVDIPANNKDKHNLDGGKRSSDTESLSSVSTTEILSKDPLFLVLSEFLMDDETGSNIVHIGNDIVKVLSKINSKLGRIADSLEKKQKKDKMKKRQKE